MTKVYNRKTKKIEEIKHIAEKPLKKIYSSKFITNIATNKFISKVYGLYNKTFLSKYKIPKFIKNNNINMSLYEDKKYKSFNEFFIRKYKKLNFDEKDFISPCDAKLSVYKINKNMKVKVKNFTYTLEELLDTSEYNFSNAYMFIYRLSVDDCHRYYYIDDGILEKRVRVKGKLHTVSDTSSNYKIYRENEREYSVLNTKNFGQIIYMEVGALLIGKIINHDLKEFKRGEEKGYFLPGGSTVIVIANNIEVDNDILKNSENDIETLVRIGEKVGKKKR